NTPPPNKNKIKHYPAQSLGFPRQNKHRRGEGQSLGNLGIAYYSLGNYGKAIKSHEQSLAIAREIKDRRGEGQSLGNLGNAYYSLGNYDKAIESQEQRLAIAREIKDRQGEGQSLNNLGNALFKSGNLTGAAKTLMDGITTWELLRQTGAGNDANKVSIFEEQARTYRSLQRVLIAQNKPNAALEIAERGRGRAFVELLAQRLGEKQLAVSGQRLAVSGQQSVRSPSLVEIQQIAKAQNATLVQYSIIYNDLKLQGKQEAREAELYIWVIQPTGEITFRKADLKPLWQQQNASLEALVDQSRVALGARSRSDSDIVVSLTPQALQQSQEKQTRNLKQLHQLLIQPIASLLPKDPTQRVIFVPQNELFLVPFPALVDANGKALIEQHTILTAPAIQVLALTRQ
ncbi:MAG: tetratricopeptide repeat protein, partial [Leptolyngbyaceae cyanobacterium CAN_BIN12]|nr:tetratricopeptide repeat protein [Leptolyngbyaceae cyanobacterium CAN_BIN12]